MKRATYKTIIEQQKQQQQFQDFPKLKEILVNLSVKNSPKVERKLRFIGHRMEFIEYNDRKAVPGEKNKFVKVPFPDAEQNRKITRIGHDDPDKCPWKAMGYIGSRRFATNCLEQQEDGTWLPKILCKGTAIFNHLASWEEGRHEEDDDSVSMFLGGRKAPVVKIHAVYDSSKLGNVDYKVFVGSKDMELTEEHINMLRTVREPSADEMNAFRMEYEADREEDPSLPEWEDFFEYGYDLRRIFKYTPPVEPSNQVLKEEVEAVEEDEDDDPKEEGEDDDFKELKTESKAEPKATKGKAKKADPATTEEADEEFEDLKW